MIRIHRIAAALVTAVAGTIGLLAASPAAFAATAVFPADGGYGGSTPAPVQTVTVVSGGMPGWQIALIAVGAALLAAIAAVLADRARSTQRRLTLAS